MKRTLATLVLFFIPFAAFGQTTKIIKGASNFIVLDRSVPWSTFVSFGQNYLIDDVSPSVGLCLYIHNNNPTNSRTVGFAILATGDPTVSNPAIGTNFVVVSNGGLTVPAGATLSQFARSFGSYHTGIAINSESGTAGGSPDTADILVVQGNECVTGLSNKPSSPPPPSQVQLPNQFSVSSGPAAGTQATATVAGASGLRNTAVTINACMLQSAATASEQTVFIFDSATCSGTILWQGGVAVPATAGSGMCNTQSGLQITGTSGGAMTACIGAGAAGVFERITLTGFQQ